MQAVFQQQSVRWKAIADQFAEKCYIATYNFLKQAIMHVAGQHTGAKIMAEFTFPWLESQQKLLDRNVQEVAWPYRQCHPITYSLRYFANSDVLSEDNSPTTPRNFKAAIEHLDMENPEELLSAVKVIDQAERYYEVSYDPIHHKAIVHRMKKV